MAFEFGVGSVSVAALFCFIYLATYLGRCLLAWHRYQSPPRQRVLAALLALTSLGIVIGGFTQPAIETLWNSAFVHQVRTQLTARAAAPRPNVTAK